MGCMNDTQLNSMTDFKLSFWYLGLHYWCFCSYTKNHGFTPIYWSPYLLRMAMITQSLTIRLIVCLVPRKKSHTSGCHGNDLRKSEIRSAHAMVLKMLCQLTTSDPFKNQLTYIFILICRQFRNSKKILFYIFTKR